jgi:hypothetical protein
VVRRVAHRDQNPAAKENIMPILKNTLWKHGGTVYTKITDPIERRDAIAVVEKWFRKAKLN